MLPQGKETVKKEIVKEEPSSIFQRQRVDMLLSELTRHFPVPPVPQQNAQGAQSLVIVNQPGSHLGRVIACSKSRSNTVECRRYVDTIYILNRSSFLHIFPFELPKNSSFGSFTSLQDFSSATLIIYPGLESASRCARSRTQKHTSFQIHYCQDCLEVTRTSQTTVDETGFAERIWVRSVTWVAESW